MCKNDPIASRILAKLWTDRWLPASSGYFEVKEKGFKVENYRKLSFSFLFFLERKEKNIYEYQFSF